MKYFIFFIAAIVSLNSAATTRLKPVDPIVFSINLSKEKAWQKILDLFVANSIPIKLMDKSSGLIQSEKIGLGSHYTLKNADDGTVWALCEVVNVATNDNFYLYPQTINTELQVYIREATDSTVLLSINLMNLSAKHHDAYTGNDREFELKSTKRLENIVANYFSTNERMPTLAFDPPFATFGDAPSQIEKINKMSQVTVLEIENEDKQVEKTNIILTLLGSAAAIIAIFIRLYRKKD